MIEHSRNSFPRKKQLYLDYLALNFEFKNLFFFLGAFASIVITHALILNLLLLLNSYFKENTPKYFGTWKQAGEKNVGLQAENCLGELAET